MVFNLNNSKRSMIQQLTQPTDRFSQGITAPLQLPTGQVVQGSIGTPMKAPQRAPAQIAAAVNTTKAPTINSIPKSNAVPVQTQAIKSMMQESPQNVATPTPQMQPIQQLQTVQQPDRSRLNSLQNEFSSLMQPSERENELQAQLDNIISSRELGLNEIRDQTIPMRFITGQADSLQRSAQTAALPLEQQLARLQSARQAQQNALESQIGFERDSITPQASEGFTLGEGQSRFDASGNLIARNFSGAANNTGGFSNEVLSFAQLINDGRTNLENVPSNIRGQVAAALSSIPQGQTLAQTQAIENANTAISEIDKALGIIGGNTTGRLNTAGSAFGRAVFGLAPGSDVRNLQAALSPVRALIGFDALQKMREASPTGGALGQVTERELAFLQAVQGSLDTTQGTQQLTQTLDKIRRSFERVRAINAADISPEEYERLFPDASVQEIAEYIQRQQSGFNTVGSDTQQAPRVAEAIAQVESGGRYDAIGPATAKGDRAYGKYQIMDFNIPAWSEEVLGYPVSVQQFLETPEIQDAIAHGKIAQYLQQYGNADDAAAVWFSGRPLAGNTSADVTGTNVPEYVNRVRRFLI